MAILMRRRDIVVVMQHVEASSLKLHLPETMRLLGLALTRSRSLIG